MNEHWKPGMPTQLLDPDLRGLKEAMFDALWLDHPELLQQIMTMARMKTALHIQDERFKDV